MTQFNVWAPFAETVAVHAIAPDRYVEMARDERGYFSVAFEAPAGTRYFYRLNDLVDRPDPASRFQPEGVHGPSEVVDGAAYIWADGAWEAPTLKDYIIYELHTGAFTEEGTFQSACGQLGRLGELGVTAIELMPVAQFPGRRNWGYDGVFPFAVQASYGGPTELKRFIDSCHQKGLAVILDVVYNHLGPEGNYLASFGPYFSKARTPWGGSLNFNGPNCEEVRRFFIENALFWLEEFHLDALRLDAVHAMPEDPKAPILKEMAFSVQALAAQTGRRKYLIAERNLHDPLLTAPTVQGGMGIDSQWCDDLHRCIHVAFTGEEEGEYAKFEGTKQLAQVLSFGFAYSRTYEAEDVSRVTPAPPSAFVAFTQNHDQVGNRPGGERLSVLTGFEQLKTAAGLLLLAPFVPLLFMGEEYAETAPFYYFTDHSDVGLGDAVKRGRRRMFAAQHRSGRDPDPQAEDTFGRSRLGHAPDDAGESGVLQHFYAELIQIRKRTADRIDRHPHVARAWEAHGQVVFLQRNSETLDGLAVFNLGDQIYRDKGPGDGPIGQSSHGPWKLEINSADERWLGQGIVSGGLRPKSFVFFTRERTG